ANSFLPHSCLLLSASPSKASTEITSDFVAGLWQAATVFSAPRRKEVSRLRAWQSSRLYSMRLCLSVSSWLDFQRLRARLSRLVQWLQVFASRTRGMRRCL